MSATAAPPEAKAVAKAKVIEQTIAPKVLRVPPVAIGDVVDCFHGAELAENGTPIPAIVLAVHPDGLIDAAAIPPDNYGFRLFEGSIRHRSDPVVQRLISQDSETHCWDVSPSRLTKAEVARLRELMNEFKPTA